MKHVFVINSHTTFLTSNAVIQNLNLNADGIIILLNRNYSNSSLDIYKKIDATSYALDFENVFSSWTPSRHQTKKLISATDDLINKEIKEEYHLYAPHLGHPMWQVLYTNSYCVFFSYIQEGFIPFKNTYKQRVPILGRLYNYLTNFITQKRVWIYRSWYIGNKIKNHNTINSYSLDDSFFKYLPVPNNILKAVLPNVEYNYDITTNDAIFIFDGFVSNGLMAFNDYVSECKMLILENAKGVNFLKFHPGQTEKEKDTILNIFKENNLKYRILNSNIPFEYFIISNSGYHFVGFGSSLLFLAYKCGHNVTCYDDRLLKYKTYQKYKKGSGFVSFKEFTESI